MIWLNIQLNNYITITSRIKDLDKLNLVKFTYGGKVLGSG